MVGAVTLQAVALEPVFKAGVYALPVVIITPDVGIALEVVVLQQRAYAQMFEAVCAQLNGEVVQDILTPGGIYEVIACYVILRCVVQAFGHAQFRENGEAVLEKIVAAKAGGPAVAAVAFVARSVMFEGKPGLNVTAAAHNVARLDIE